MGLGGLLFEAMKSPKRIAIVDRSLLAQNLYGILLKPLGFSLFPFKSLHELKENFNGSFRLNALLINSNVFGKNFDLQLDWLQNDPRTKPLVKFFVCKKEEKKLGTRLKKISRNWIYRPFDPAQLGLEIQAGLQGKHNL